MRPLKNSIEKYLKNTLQSHSESVSPKNLKMIRGPSHPMLRMTKQVKSITQKPFCKGLIVYEGFGKISMLPDYIKTQVDHPAVISPLDHSRLHMQIKHRIPFPKVFGHNLRVCEEIILI